MRTVDRILSLIDERNITEYQVIKNCNLPINAFNSWRKDKAKPSVDALMKISDYFGVSVDYLLGRATPTAKSTITPLDLAVKQSGASEIDDAHLELWQQLDEEQQVEVNGIIKGMLLVKKKMEAK